MKFFKKSLGQNFLIEKNIVKKIVNLSYINKKNVLEIGPGKGYLTDEILKKKPKNLILIEKDYNLAKYLKEKYSAVKTVTVINCDILKFDLTSLLKRKLSILGNLPYNISSQILIKVLKEEKIINNLDNLIFMFQKELGEKIISKFPSKHYGRLSIITSFKLKIIKKFLVSPNCFFPKPKVTSMVVHFRPYKNKSFYIKNLYNLEKVTNILFSNKRKMINKNLKKILNDKNIKKISGLNQNLRAENISPNIFYKITEVFETN